MYMSRTVWFIAMCCAENVLYRWKYSHVEPIPVTVRSKASVCCRSLVGTAGLSLAGGMYVSCECCMLSNRGLCDGLIIRPEESYRMWCVLSVSVKPWQWGGGLDPLGAVEPRGGKMYVSRPYVGNAICCHASVLYRWRYVRVEAFWW